MEAGGSNAWDYSQKLPAKIANIFIDKVEINFRIDWGKLKTL